MRSLIEAPGNAGAKVLELSLAKVILCGWALNG